MGEEDSLKLFFDLESQILMLTNWFSCVVVKPIISVISALKASVIRFVFSLKLENIFGIKVSKLEDGSIIFNYQEKSFPGNSKNSERARK